MRSRDPARKAALVVVALVACVAAYAVIASIVDTQSTHDAPPARAALDAGKP